VRRCATVSLTLLVAASATLTFAPSSQAATSTSDLKARLDQARISLSVAQASLRTARAALQAARSSGSAADVATQRTAIRHLKRQITALRRSIARLRFQIEYPMVRGPHGTWGRTLRLAAKKYHLSVRSLTRMMLLESGGRVRAVGGGGLFYGLFQYAPSTWKSAWNPWRNYSIFHGGAQIWATATAIHRGWGRSMWPNTYPMAFGWGIAVAAPMRTK
jgi:hypothetical protein